MTNNNSIFQRVLAVFLVFGFLLTGLNSAANAESAEKFLKNLSGSWRGKGSVYISEKAKKAPIRCKITSVFSKQKRTLTNKGRCATTQKKSRISGKIRYSATGNKLTGSYINALGNYTVTKSSGSISGSKMILHTTLNNTSINKISRTRNVLKRVSGRKFIVTVFEKIDGSFKRRGVITFTK